MPGRVAAELVVVPSATAAILEVDKRVPDLLLVGRSISLADQEVVLAHTKSKSATTNLLTMAIPELQVAEQQERRSKRFGLRKPTRSDGWDPSLFAAIATCVAEIEVRRRADSTASDNKPGRPQRAGGVAKGSHRTSCRYDQSHDRADAEADGSALV